MATMDEAKICSKCGEPGETVSIKPAREQYQGKVHIIECKNERCKGYDPIDKMGRRWIVQVKPDGTIPDARSTTDRKGGGSFPQMSPGQQAAAQRGIEQIQEEERRSRESN
jgi:hypothetical protein